MTRYGISVPNFGVNYGNTENLVLLAQTAEASGWDAVFLWDHIQIGHWAGDVLDPWVAMTVMAAATERLIVGPMVTPLPRRRPTKLAREAVTLDHFSGGRLILGVGIGWLLVVENLIWITAPDITHLLPGGTLSALAAGGTADLSWASALGLTLLYGAAAACVSLFAFRNRDIVS